MRVVYISGIANTAHAYNDALRRVGSAAKIGKGGTEEIGMYKFTPPGLPKPEGDRYYHDFMLTKSFASLGL